MPGGEIEGEAAEVEPAAEGEPPPPRVPRARRPPHGPEEELGRTDDPVRMYLREMGTIELLSREGEIEIAKRIEAGRNTVLEALCESPLTMRAVIGWRDAIREGRVLLRDIIDLEATNDAGPTAEAAAAIADGANGATDRWSRSRPWSRMRWWPWPPRSPRWRSSGAAPAARRRPRADGDADEDEEDDEAPLAGEDEEAEAGHAAPELLEEDDFDEDTLSLSALENKLRDGVLETFDGIAEAYRGLRDLQEERLALHPGAPRGAGRAGPRVSGGPLGHGRADAADLAQPEPGRGAGPAAVRRQQAPAEPRGQAAPAGDLGAGSPARASLPTIWATSSTTTGSTASRG